jgi:uncharacterized protein (TIGR03083 family)
MELSPRYGASPVVVFDDDPQSVCLPLIRERERLQALLDDLSPDEWQAPSRCEGWTVKDVVAHLVSVNNYWSFSITSGVAGTPTEVLANFDPVAVPAALAAAEAATPAEEMAERFRVSNRQVLDVVASLDDSGWTATAESPIGHVPVALVAHHALWDFLIHEWDIALPLARPRVAEHDEVVASLAYAAALSAALMLLGGAAVPSPIAIDMTDPAAALVIETGESVHVARAHAIHGAHCWRGDAVALLETTSVRAPLPQSTPDEWRAVLAGLHETFDQPV